MKLSRARMLAWVLALITILSLFPLASQAASVPADAKKLVQAAQKYKGRNGVEMGYWDQWCAMFVQTCGQDAGLVSKGIFPQAGATATYVRDNEASSIYFAVSMADWFTEKGNGKYYYFDLTNKNPNPKSRVIKSSRSSFKPQAGDLIFFDYDSVADIDHVGIVTGFKGSEVSFISGNSGSGGSWQRRRVTTDTRAKTSTSIVGYVRPNYAKTSSEPVNPEDVKITFSSVSGPGTIQQGHGDHIKGTIRSTGSEIASITAVVKDESKKQVLKKTVKPDTFEYVLEDSDLDWGLTFGDLKAGKYTITYTVTTASGKKATKNVALTVKGAEKPKDVKITFKSVKGPGTVKKGVGQHISGTVEATNSKIATIKGSVKNSKGKEVLKKTVKPNAYKYVLKDSDLDWGLPFGDLSKGSYKLTFTVTTASGKKATKTVSFKVS